MNWAAWWLKRANYRPGKLGFQQHPPEDKGLFSGAGCLVETFAVVIRGSGALVGQRKWLPAARLTPN